MWFFFLAICSSCIYIQGLRLTMSVPGFLTDPKPPEYVTPVLHVKALLSCYHWVGGSGRCPDMVQFSLLDDLFSDSSIKKMNSISTSTHAHCQEDLLCHSWAHIGRPVSVWLLLILFWLSNSIQKVFGWHNDMQSWLPERRPRSSKMSNHYRMLRFPISPCHQLDPYISNSMGHCINRNVLFLVQEHSLLLQEFMLGNLICVCVHSCSVVSSTLPPQWTVVHQASLTMGFPRQEYWSGLPFPTLGNLPNQGIEPVSPVCSAL